VQVLVNPIHALRLVAINVDFVGNAEVPERLVQNEGSGLAHRPGVRPAEMGSMAAARLCGSHPH